ncbi:MAG: OmpH family outer membrane protein [Thiotrichaceae bacterium]|nr:OmpH family outer membrane protein [Thiotrichaceae bacterium]
MNKIIKMVLVGVMPLLLALPVVAADLKLGYVDAVKLFQEAPQAAQSEVMLRQEFAEREKELLASQAKVKALDDRLRRDAMVMSESERKKIDNELTSISRDMRRNQEEFREDLNRRRNEEIAKVQEFIKQVIDNLGREEDFDLIFFEGIAFANPELEITSKVLTRLQTLSK